MFKPFQTLKRKICFGLLLAALPLAGHAQAQNNFPNRPIRLIVPFATGGVTDTSGRLIAEQLSKRLGQQVIVDNKPGANGAIAAEVAALVGLWIERQQAAGQTAVDLNRVKDVRAGIELALT